VDVLRRAASPMTSRQISDALLAGKNPTATRKQEEALNNVAFEKHCLTSATRMDDQALAFVLAIKYAMEGLLVADIAIGAWAATK
jgi:hypothetical protein